MTDGGNVLSLPLNLTVLLMNGQTYRLDVTADEWERMLAGLDAVGWVRCRLASVRSGDYAQWITLHIMNIVGFVESDAPVVVP